MIVSKARLLCFDELQVNDIADAMILGRLFEALFSQGVVMVATANRPPDDLYKDGVNRQLFLPFIAMLKARLEVVPVPGERDYRLDRLRAGGVWFSPLDGAAEGAFDDLWWDLLSGAEESGATLEVLGPQAASAPRRRRPAPRLLRQPLRRSARTPGLSGHRRAVPHGVPGGIPVIPPEGRDQARRLINLVDALYEARARLVVLAAAEPEALYRSGDAAFDFARPASRLQEMRSREWLEGAAWRPA